MVHKWVQLMSDNEQTHPAWEDGRNTKQLYHLLDCNWIDSAESRHTDDQKMKVIIQATISGMSSIHSPSGKKYIQAIQRWDTNNLVHDRNPTGGK